MMVSFYVDDPASLSCSLMANFRQASILTLGVFHPRLVFGRRNRFKVATTTRSSTQNAKKKNSRNKLLGGGFKDLLCSSRSFGEMIQFHLPIFFKTTNGRLSCKGHVFFATKGW